jgi:glycosyltransferase involved in cell wall biosynthesis
MPPFISVIMPIFNGAFTLERALRSTVGQRFADWEIVAVDDGSTDDTWQILQRWAAADRRIRAVRLEENRGVAGARNTAIERAEGEVLAFLDRDDEYYPDYLANVRRLCPEADVLVFGYDYVYEDGPAADRMPSWNPASIRQDLFLQNIVMPLGVAHWRKWWQKAGGFHEGSWQPDWDYWKRLVRVGARLDFPPLKSGRYHVRLTGANRRAHITPRQHKMFLDNWQAGKPMYGPRPLVANHPKARKIAFVSAHCAIDPTNGAATSTLDGLKLLQEAGFDCHVFCCSHLDAQEEVPIESLLQQYGSPYELRDARIGSYEGRILFTSHRKVPVTLFRAASSRQWASPAEQEAFLAACDHFLKESRPDLVWTYGGDPSAYAIQRLAKRLDIPVLFALHNFSYFDPVAFVATDYVLVFSEFSRQYYWDSIRLACQKFPLVVDPQRVEVAEWKPEYVTFVNPEPRKGVFVFARIAESLFQRRPDIPLLVVEGIAKRHWLPQLGIDFSRMTNLRIVPTTPNPRDFYAVSKILLMPSLMEPAGLVAMEGMFNGIPVLAGKRGGLTEIVGDGGFLFEIPGRCTAESRAAPTAEEVEPWVETIIRLWDNSAYFDKWSQAARRRGQLWHPDTLKPVYREFFENVFVQPAPPLVP